VGDLNTAPPYDALSYVWGTELNPDPILCNGVNMTVTKQLADALRHLRRYPGWGSVLPWPKDHPLCSGRNAWNGFARNRHEHHKDSIGEQEVLLWVDALCINQEDATERADQVKMMGKIYAQASNVKIWLGKEDKETPNFVTSKSTMGPPGTYDIYTALSAMQNAQFDAGRKNNFHIGNYGKVPIVLSFIAQALRNASGPKNRLATIRPVEDSAHRNIAYGFPPSHAPEWSVVREFFTNPWFERVWCVQEAVLASNATALIGEWEIDWTAIGRAAVWFRSKGYAVPAVLKYQLRDHQDLLPVSKPASAWDLCSRPDKKVPLLDLLHEFRNRLATNPVDKVYAAFGMAAELSRTEKDGFHELVEPNYTSKTVLDVYRDIAKFLIIEHGNLAVLSHAGASPQSEWPSWAPDWRHDKASNALSTTSSTSAYNTTGTQPLAIDISNKVNSISLQGIEVDTIIAYGDRLASYGFGFVTYQEEVDFVKMAWALFSQRPPDTFASNTYDDAAAAFIQTLTAGLSNNNRLVSEDPSFQADALHWFAQHTPRMLPGATLLQRLKWSVHESPDSGRFHEAFVRACVDRRFFVTRKGYIGIGPDTMNEGDVITILFGGRVPYLLQPVGASYKFLGECYVPGLMGGEAVQRWKDEGSKRNFFDLV